MSKWTDIRDSITGYLKVDDVTEEVKEKVSQAILDEILPPIETVVDDFVDKLKQQAPGERGGAGSATALCSHWSCRGQCTLLRWCLRRRWALRRALLQRPDFTRQKKSDTIKTAVRDGRAVFLYYKEVPLG